MADAGESLKAFEVIRDVAIVFIDENPGKCMDGLCLTRGEATGTNDV